LLSAFTFSLVSFAALTSLFSVLTVSVFSFGSSVFVTFCSFALATTSTISPPTDSIFSLALAE